MYYATISPEGVVLSVEVRGPGNEPPPDDPAYMRIDEAQYLAGADGRLSLVDGEFVVAPPPPPAPPPPRPKKLSQNAFRNLVRTATGGDAAARIRLQAVEDGMATSTDPLVRSYYADFAQAADIDLADMGPVWALLVTAGLYEQAEIDAIVAAWPRA